MRSEMTIVITRKVTFSALVWLLPCVNERMSLQIATPVERFVALFTNVFLLFIMGFLVHGNMFFKVIMIFARIGTLRALVWLLLCMNERMCLQIGTPVERFVAPLTNIFFDSSVDFLVISKVLPACKCLGTQVTRYLFGHFHLSPPLCPDFLQ